MKEVETECPGKCAELFRKRIDVAEEALNMIDFSDPLIQHQLKDVFLDWVKDDAVADK